MRALPGLVLCPGFPSAANGGSKAAERIYPLADRIAQTMEWAGMVLNYRGCGESEGDFSLEGWADDVRSAVDHLNGLEQVEGVWLAGFGIGGALAAHVAQDDSRVRGVATMGSPVDFARWGLDASGVVEYARSLGIVSSPGFPDSVGSWAKAAQAIRVDRSAAEIAPRPMLVLHGSNDVEVSPPRCPGHCRGPRRRRPAHHQRRRPPPPLRPPLHRHPPRLARLPNNPHSLTGTSSSRVS